MKRLPSFRLSLAVAASAGVLSAFVACGGISDPTRGSSERIATVSGALTGASIPPNTRVALVWNVANTGALASGNDVAVVNGAFSMDLSVPPASYFASLVGDYGELSSGASAAPDDPVPSTSSSGGPSGAGSSDGPSGASSSGSPGNAFAFGAKLSPRDTVSGQITQPLTAAVAGFIVYVDTNGNGKLDLEGPNATPVDEVIGGNKELLLAYLRDGGSLDYEKLRDRSGILPAAGYNLAWQEGRWLPLNVVELQLSPRTRLPGAVCSSYDVTETTPSAPRPTAPPPSGGGYPSPDDPRLKCTNGGYSYTYEPDPSDCSPAPTTTAPGLCTGAYDDEALAIGCGGGGSAWLDPDQPVPLDWPCPVGDASVGIDAGPAPDSGAAIDAGSAPDAGQ